MTFREKLKQEHPEMVNERYIGGCKGCPAGYGYEGYEDNWPNCSHATCAECWGREIPVSEVPNSSDLISRQAAIDEIITWLKDRMTDGKNGKPLTDRIKDLPPAQPEIIYCKDCDNLKSDEYHHWCKSHGGFFNPEKDFCSRAERRTDD